MHAQVDKERFCRNKPKKRYSEFVKLTLHCGRLAEKKIGQKKKKTRLSFRSPRCYLCLNAAAGISLSKGRSSGRDAPSLTYSTLWLISRGARGAVRSHSLIGEHMSGPICHWLLWEWHQRWPLDPRLTEKCFCNSFPLQRRESMDTRRICRNGEIGKLEKAFRPVFDLSCFSFLAGSSYEMSIWPINKAFLILLRFFFFFFHDRPPKAITADKTGINPPTCIDSIHFAWCGPPFFFHLWWCVPACLSGYVWISLECICRGSN